MGDQIWSYVTGLLGKAVPLYCGTDDYIAARLDLSKWQFASAKAGLLILFLAPIITAWYASWGRFRANGFNRKVWRFGLWFLIAITMAQIAGIFAEPALSIALCPYDTLTIILVTILALYGLYCFHLGAGNKGSFAKFLLFIAGPLLGEVALNSREAGASGARILVHFIEITMTASGHLYSLVHV